MLDAGCELRFFLATVNDLLALGFYFDGVGAVEVLAGVNKLADNL